MGAILSRWLEQAFAIRTTASANPASDAARRHPYGFFTSEFFEMGGIGLDARRGLARRHGLPAASRGGVRRLPAGISAVGKGSLGSARLDGEAGAEVHGQCSAYE